MDNVDNIVKKYLKPQIELRDALVKEAFKAWMIGAGILTVILLCTGQWITPAEWQGAIFASLFFTFFLVFIPYLAIKGQYGSYMALKKVVMEDENSSTVEANNPTTHRHQGGNEKSDTFSEMHEESKNDNSKEDLQHEIEVLRKDNNQLSKAVMQLQKEKSILQEELKKSPSYKGW